MVPQMDLDILDVLGGLVCVLAWIAAGWLVLRLAAERMRRAT
jgi:hypothetical protein